MTRTIFVAYALCFSCVSISHSQSVFPGGVSKPLGELIANAEETTVLHEAHTPPYHLKASIVETTNPRSEYHGEVEEFFQSEKAWQRTLTVPGLKWKQEMTEGKLSEEYSGDYAPLWARELLAGITNPLPEHSALERLRQPMQAFKGNAARSCIRNIPEYLEICFEGEHLGFKEILSSPGGLGFEDFQPFHKKWVARRVFSNPESGTNLLLTVTELSDLKGAAQDMIVKPDPVPLIVVQVSQNVMQSFLKSDPNLNWPAIHGGSPTGLVHVFLGIGPDGRVREAWPDGNDHPDLEDFARQQVKSWQFTPYLLNGYPVAVSIHWSLPFQTTVTP